ncbi:MAG: hypothetical protein DRO88_01370 [Promethearchaeia archaeon]|nr:MAG: hypothetical protein DRO88_01370 [Candidatus Lokiarchaeia archaeon]
MISQPENHHLIILALINNHPEGMTGYSIVKEINAKFAPVWTPGPGTIYPKLKQLLDQGALAKEGSKYRITQTGREFIAQHIPEALNLSMNFLPAFFKVLIHPINQQIPFDIHIFKNPCFFGVSQFKQLPTQWNVEELERLQQMLKREKQRATQWVQEYVKQIDEDIQVIEEKVNEMKEKAKIIPVKVVWEQE